MNCDRDSQKTDVHYRSLNGEGKFNWRMIFPFHYLISEKKVSSTSYHAENYNCIFYKVCNVSIKKIVTTKKRRFYEKFDTIVKSPPLLNVQIWDNDTISADDFIGEVWKS